MDTSNNYGHFLKAQQKYVRNEYIKLFGTQTKIPVPASSSFNG